MSELRALSLTHVVYQPGDAVGYALAIITLTPIFIAVMYGTLLVVRRDSATIYMFLGQLLTLVLNVVLKKTINQSRPNIMHEFEGEGMPSNHAQFTFFFCMYTILSLRRSKAPHWEKLIGVFTLLALAFTVAVSRVYLGYHTVEQVVVGAVIGALGGYAWHVLYDSHACSWMTWMCSLPLAKQLYIRDYSKMGYSAVDEYHAWKLFQKRSNGADR